MFNLKIKISPLKDIAQNKMQDEQVLVIKKAINNLSDMYYSFGGLMPIEQDYINL